ncbi:kinase-like protein [Pilatotrama ljubarskyi]|nr:kinase-like protein [Pilatotrama ljubarskyi]
MKRLEHANICQLREFFLDRHGLSLVLELVSGRDLYAFILKRERSRKLFSEAQVYHIIYQICDAVAYVHTQGIVHRDLKPENVLLTNDNPPIVKVADFGLAKVVDTFTDLRSTVGSEVFVAPEVMDHGPEGYSQVVDSWSVGVMTLIMLTLNDRPFINDNPNTDRKTRVLSREIDWQSLHELSVSQQCEDFVHRLLVLDPGRRMTLVEARRHPWLATPQGSRDPFSIPPEDIHTPVDPDAHSPDTPDPNGQTGLHQEVSNSTARPSRRSGTANTGDDRLSPTPSLPDGDADAPQTDVVRASKRKVEVRSSASLIPRSESQVHNHDSAETTPRTDAQAAERTKPTSPAQATRKARAPNSKTARMGSRLSPTVSVGSDDVPGLFLRRSPRLNPSIASEPACAQ